MKSLLPHLACSLLWLAAPPAMAADPALEEAAAPDPTDAAKQVEGKGWFKEENAGVEGQPSYWSFHTAPEAGGYNFYLLDLPAETARTRTEPATYRLELREVSWKGPDGTPGAKEVTLAKLYQGNQLICDATVCSMHHAVMKRQLVPIHYGIAAAGDWKAIATSFPHGANAVNAGCCVVSEKRTAWSWVCPECEKARQDWEAKHFK